MIFRYHTRHGREAFARPGQIIAAGSFINCEPITEDYIVKVGLFEGNPYDEIDRKSKSIFVEPLSKHQNVTKT